MRKNKTNKIFLGFLVLLFIFTTSCVDNGYDLNKDIDLTITIGGDHLGLPTSNTEEITLKKIFDLDDDSDIKADKTTGDYSLTKDGDGSNTDVTVDNVTISGNEIDIQEASTSLEFSKPPHGVTAAVVAAVDDNSFLDIEKNDVTTDVVSISNAIVASNVTIRLNFSGGNTVNKLSLESGFQITFPDYLKVEYAGNAATAGYELVNNHILKFTRNQEVTKNGKLAIPLRISNINFTKLQEGNESLSQDKKQGLYQSGKFRINDKIKINGNTFINSGDFGSDQQVRLNLITNVDIPSIQITEITGIVDPKINNINIDNVTINNLPDFLQNDEVVMDVDNPKILLTISNSSPIDVTISGELQPLKKGLTLPAVKFGEMYNSGQKVIVPANVTNYVICLSRRNIADPTADATVQIADLNNLIKTIPDEIAFNNIKAKSIQEEREVRLGRTFNVTTKYEFKAPLAFGDDLNIIYKDTMDGWNEDVQDYEFKKAIVKIDAKNIIPLEMELTATAMDANDKPITGITAVVTDNKKVAAGDGKTAKETKDLEIVLTTVNPADMKKLDGLELNIVATSGEHAGVNLNEGQSLKLDNIRIKVPGGVKVDLN